MASWCKEQLCVAFSVSLLEELSWVLMRVPSTLRTSPTFWVCVVEIGESAMVGEWWAHFLKWYCLRNCAYNAILSTFQVPGFSSVFYSWWASSWGKELSALKKCFTVEKTILVLGLIFFLMNIVQWWQGVPNHVCWRQRITLWNWFCLSAVYCRNGTRVWKALTFATKPSRQPEQTFLTLPPSEFLS